MNQKSEQNRIRQRHWLILSIILAVATVLFLVGSKISSDHPRDPDRTARASSNNDKGPQESPDRTRAREERKPQSLVKLALSGRSDKIFSILEAKPPSEWEVTELAMLAESLRPGDLQRFWEMMARSGLKRADLDRLHAKAIQFVALQSHEGFLQAKTHLQGLSETGKVPPEWVKGLFESDKIDYAAATRAATDFADEKSYQAALDGIISRLGFEKDLALLEASSPATLAMLAKDSPDAFAKEFGLRLANVPRAQQGRAFDETLALLKKYDNADGSYLGTFVENAMQFAPDAAWKTFTTELVGMVPEDSLNRSGAKIVSQYAHDSPQDALDSVLSLSSTSDTFRKNLASSAMDEWIESSPHEAIEWWSRRNSTESIAGNNAISASICRAAMASGDEKAREMALSKIADTKVREEISRDGN